ncbi:MAG: (Fe-S)-binding protein [Cytophagaceae bacterium]|jgi:L-lactate dehydrogenase complex protein LldE|nr:(Fe-S)-binding protein [Cytophagaceae bacterium]
MKKNKKVVDIFIPCFVDQVYPETGFSMVKVLEHLGCEVHYNPDQTCCGQPAFNAGYFDEAREVAIKFLKDFPSSDRYVVSPSASCVGMVCNSYSRLFDHTSYVLEYKRIQRNTFELTDFITNVLGIQHIPGAHFNAKVTYHDSCSALRECKIKEGPRKLLESVKGIEILELKDNETCCGFGGTFAVKFEPISVGMAEQKVTNAIETGADIITSTDVSCLMHLDGYIKKNQLPIRTLHIADILASGLK